MPSTDLQALLLRRRRLLLRATGISGSAVAALAAWPFLASMSPSERARAGGAAVTADISGLDDAALMTLEWRGRPVWVLHRTPAMLAQLERDSERLSDPLSARSIQPAACRNPWRALRPAWFVAYGLCTHLGCVPTFRPDAGAADLGADWPGGFYCPCHGSRFDLAGRVFRDVPAPVNLEIPPHRFLSSGQLQVGDDDAPA